MECVACMGCVHSAASRMGADFAVGVVQVEIVLHLHQTVSENLFVLSGVPLCISLCKEMFATSLLRVVCVAINAPPLQQAGIISCVCGPFCEVQNVHGT